MKDEFEIFVHAQGRKPMVVKVGDDDILVKVLEGLDLGGMALPDAFIFIGGDDDELNGDEEGDDAPQPLDPKLFVNALGLRDHRHVHIGRCKRVAIDVNFNGKTKHRKVSPGRTVGAVTKWARRAFRIDPSIAAEYVLQICGATKQPRPDINIGELTTAPVCAVCFDLVKEITPQG